MPISRTHLLLAAASFLAVVWPLPGAGAPAESGEPLEAVEARLAAQAELEPILRLALQRNPDLAQENARLRASLARARQAGRLPEPQLKYEQWGVPVRRPLALPDGNALMVGLSQSLPPPGTLALRARVAQQESRTAAATADTRRRELRAQTRRAFAEYYRADRELALHREHVELTARLIELARASYRGGQRGQQDVLRLGLELARLHRDLARIEQERLSAQALLNALMNRPPEARLGPPAELAAPPAPRAGAEAGLEARRGEVSAALAAVSRSESELELARRERRWPSLTLGADYMYMPSMEERHGYGAMVIVNLPWLSRGRGDALEAAEQALVADRHALESVRNALRYQAREARVRFEAARSTFEILDKDLLPSARRNLDAAQAGYGTGQGDAIALVDALRSYLETRIDRLGSLVDLENAAADLDRVLAGKEQTP